MNRSPRVILSLWLSQISSLRRPSLAVVALTTLIAPSSFAVVNGQMDTFEDGTTDGWIVGLLGAPHPAPPVNIPTGGPSGVNDNYLQLTAIGGNGPGSRLSVLNPAQWAGDYLAAGITSIRMDVANFGNNDLDLRLQFEDPQGGPPTDIAISQNAIHLPAGSGWTPILFPINPADLEAVSGSVNAALMNTTILRIFHSAAGTVPGESIVATLGVDNVQALSGSVPETSSTLALLTLSLLAFTPLIIRRTR